MSSTKDKEGATKRAKIMGAFLMELSTVWQPIATAPSRGKIRLWWRNSGECIGHYEVDESWVEGKATPREGWLRDGDQCIPRNQQDCTHWMLPSLPPPGQEFPHMEGQESNEAGMRATLGLMFENGWMKSMPAIKY